MICSSAKCAPQSKAWLFDFTTHIWQVRARPKKKPVPENHRQKNETEHKYSRADVLVCPFGTWIGCAASRRGAKTLPSRRELVSAEPKSQATKSNHGADYQTDSHSFHVHRSRPAINFHSKMDAEFEWKM
jgi:hypothetical protein